MIKDLTDLTKILDDKVKPMVDAIKEADPTKEEYGVLLANFGATMTLASNLNRTLLDVAHRAQAMQAENKEEENNNESNN
ncbi:MAG: hypothetical protein K6G38_06225 [Gammaproteobacteria bacterium]|jgi:F0F1-type ATP synthase membrane subunit b/b'|nr:hypothetical protein [Gammaproteobacteria bacterium]